MQLIIQRTRKTTPLPPTNGLVPCRINAAAELLQSIENGNAVAERKVKSRRRLSNASHLLCILYDTYHMACPSRERLLSPPTWSVLLVKISGTGQAERELWRTYHSSNSIAIKPGYIKLPRGAVSLIEEVDRDRVTSTCLSLGQLSKYGHRGYC